MAEKKQNPLDSLASFDPNKVEKKMPEKEPPAASKPVSPLGTSTAPRLPNGPLPTSLEDLWQEAHHEIEQLQIALAAEKQKRRQLERENYELETAVKLTQQSLTELERERQVRLGLEREISAMEVQVKEVAQLRRQLEEERVARLELERQTATLTVRAERAETWQAQLVEERKARLDLERQTATLEAEVQNARKMETLLAEERKARMNAQSRAATAEAKLSRLEGERLADQGGQNRSFWGRLRGQ